MKRWTWVLLVGSILGIPIKADTPIIFRNESVDRCAAEKFYMVGWEEPNPKVSNNSEWVHYWYCTTVAAELARYYVAAHPEIFKH